MAAERVPTVTTLAPGDLLGRPERSVLDVVTGAPVSRVALYGFGKGALRDGLAAQEYEPGAAVLLPALLPHALLEPVRELGLEPRLYDVDADLSPVTADVEAALAAAEDGGAGAAAIVAVHYFGFPQPGYGALESIAEANGVDLVSDNAHGPLSRVDGRPLGTRGAFGITSMRKLLPIPDGAALYLNRGADAYERVRSPYAGVAGGYRRAEAVFVAKSLAMGVRDRHPTATGALRRIGSRQANGVSLGDRAIGGNGTGEAVGSTADEDSEAVYRVAKRPMSRLSHQICSRMDADALVADRRHTFRTWLDHLEGVAGIEPVYRRLPDEACPQACPVLAESTDRAATITRTVPGTHTWPPLPREVTESTAYDGAVDLASRLVPLPCHRTVDEAAIRRAVGRLR